MKFVHVLRRKCSQNDVTKKHISNIKEMLEKDRVFKQYIVCLRNGIGFAATSSLGVASPAYYRSPLAPCRPHFFVAPYPATPNNKKRLPFGNLLLLLERVKGFEPSTSTLARLRSTPELRPHRQNELFNSIYKKFCKYFFHIFYIFLLF